jgi:hypothetical protein
MQMDGGIRDGCTTERADSERGALRAIAIGSEQTLVEVGCVTVLPPTAGSFNIIGAHSGRLAIGAGRATTLCSRQHNTEQHSKATRKE